MDQKPDKIYQGYSHFSNNFTDVIMIKDVLFIKRNDDSYKILEISGYTEKDVEKLSEIGYLYSFYQIKELSEYLYDGYFTNKLGLTSLINPKKPKQLTLF